jgi:serine protease
MNMFPRKYRYGGLSLLLVAGSLFAQNLPVIQETETQEVTLITDAVFINQFEFFKEDASFVKIHFSKFNIPKGVVVIVRNPEQTESYIYTKYNQRHSTKKPGDGPGSFSAMSITGDTAVITITGYHPNKNIGHNLVIDSITYGFPETQIEQMYDDYEASFVTDSTCGGLDRKPTECYRESYPKAFERTRPVARITNGRGSLCTAWRVGEGNRMITNAHCNNTQAEIAAAEVWFNYEYTTCSWSSPTKTPIVKVPGVEMLYTKHEHDITLFTVGAFDTIPQFGYLGLEPRHAVLGERIYMIGHGQAKPKQLVIESDLNEGGFCQIDDESRNGFGPDTDYGYWCDSIGGQSGSPVLVPTTHNAIALHHFGGCMNAGVKAQAFWPGISPFFGGIVPVGDDSPASINQSPVVDLQFECIYGECSFDGSGTTDPEGAQIIYDWNFGDGISSTAESGTHSYDTTGIYSVSLSVHDGDTGWDYESIIVPVTLEGENMTPINEWSYETPGDYFGVFTDESFDWDGEIVDWQWTIRDCGVYFDYPRGQQNVTHAFCIGGRQIAKLQVWDDFGDSKTVLKWITIVGPIMNESPVADFSYVVNYNVVDYMANCTDDGILSNHYHWSMFPKHPDFPATITVHEINPTFIFEMVEGETSREVATNLTCWDEYGAPSDWAGQSFIITARLPPQPVNEEPEAVITYSPEVLKYRKGPGLVMTFDGSDSTDSDGEIVAYRWIVDGLTAGNTLMLVKTMKKGRHNIALLVTDDRGGEGLTAIMVDVKKTKGKP